jgi:hypothetical protein
VYDNSPIAPAVNMEHRRNAAMTWSMAVRQFFRPHVLAFLALAVTVGGWCYGYKLSQYLPHSDITKASHTRVWAGQRDDSSKLQSHLQIDTHKLHNSSLAEIGFLRLPGTFRKPAFADPARPRILTFVSPLHPLRAPPTPSFLA